VRFHRPVFGLMDVHFYDRDAIAFILEIFPEAFFLAQQMVVVIQFPGDINDQYFPAVELPIAGQVTCQVPAFK
jgi:hypothetical protein